MCIGEPTRTRNLHRFDQWESVRSASFVFCFSDETEGPPALPRFVIKETGARTTRTRHPQVHTVRAAGKPCSNSNATARASDRVPTRASILQPRAALAVRRVNALKELHKRAPAENALRDRSEPASSIPKASARPHRKGRCLPETCQN